MSDTQRQHTAQPVAHLKTLLHHSVSSLLFLFLLFLFEKWENQLYRVLDLLLFALTYSPAARTIQHYTILSNFLSVFPAVCFLWSASERASERILARVYVCAQLHATFIHMVEDFIKFPFFFSAVVVFVSLVCAVWSRETLDIVLSRSEICNGYVCWMIVGFYFRIGQPFNTLFFMTYSTPCSFVLQWLLNENQKIEFFGKTRETKKKETSMKRRPLNPREISPLNLISRRLKVHK